ncbi:hypothetical protein EDB85DRAFT_1932478, partial [Lactarius pseudohatsudake]
TAPGFACLGSTLFWAFLPRGTKHACFVPTRSVVKVAPGQVKARLPAGRSQWQSIVTHRDRSVLSRLIVLIFF